MTGSPLPVYSVVAEVCLRCGACSTLAPGIIEMGEQAAVIRRQPVDPAEIAATDAALFNCPVFAIRRKLAASRGEVS